MTKKASATGGADNQGESSADAVNRTTQQELRYRIEFEDLILQLATHFINLPLEDLDQGIQHSLDRIGTFVDVDRCYLFQYREERRVMDNTHEWCAPMVAAQLQRLQNIPIDPDSRFVQLIESKEVVHIPQVDLVSADEFVEKDEWELEGIKSLVCVPLVIDGRVAGFIGFDSVRAPKHWTDDSIALLKIVGGMLGNACARKRAETVKQQLEAQIQNSQKLESLGVLAGGIAHDFNNLLMGLIPNAELLLAKFPKEAEEFSIVKRMHRAAKEAAELTKQLLSYAGKGRLEMGHVDLAAVVREMQPLLSAAVKKSVSLHFSLEDVETVVAADATQLRQVVMNLVTNASEAIGEASGEVTVRTGIINVSESNLPETVYLNDGPLSGEYCFIEVIDNGCGVGLESIERIFDPFYSTKFPGRGLGLAVVMGIVRGHGGAIRVSSELGVGTKFTIILPQAAVLDRRITSGADATQAAGASEDVSQDRVTPSEQVTPGEQSPAPVAQVDFAPGGIVLVVDDMELTRMAAGDILESEGYSVLYAENGRDALELIQERHQELLAVVADMTMPKMSGSELLERILAEGICVPVILSTGYSEEDAVEILAKMPFAGFLQKPYGPNEMIEILEKVVQAKRLQ